VVIGRVGAGDMYVKDVEEEEEEEEEKSGTA
jgi:hypothetical protein